MEEIAEHGRKLRRLVRRAHKGVLASWVARALPEASCPAGMVLEVRAPPETVSPPAAHGVWVDGTVTLDGSPFADALIEFQQEGEGRPSAGRTSERRWAISNGSATHGYG